MEWWALALAWFFMTVLTAPPLIRVRRTLVVPVIFGLSLCALAAGAFLGPYWRLAAFSLWLLYAVKAANLAIKNVHISTATHFIYMTVWPGMDPEHLNQKSPANDEEGYRFLQGLVCFLVGIGAALALALIQPVLAPAAVGLLGILAILLTFHFVSPAS